MVDYREVVVPLVLGQHRGRIEGPSPNRIRRVLALSQSAFQPSPSFAHMDPLAPEPPERPAKAKRSLDPAVRERPVQRRPHVIVLDLQPSEAFPLRRPNELQLGPLGHSQEVRRVRRAHGHLVATDVETLQPVLPNRLQHGEARRAISPIPGSEQALLRQGIETIEDIERQIAWCIAHGLSRLEGAPSRKDGEAGEKSLLIGIKEVVAPRDSRPQCLLTNWEVPAAACQELESLVEPGKELLGRKNADAGGGQLNGQGQAVETTADRSDGRGIALVQDEPWFDRLGALQEELHGRGCLCGRKGVLPCRRRQGQGSDWNLLLGTHSQGRTRGRQHAQPGRSIEETGDQGRGRDHLLEVIKQQERLAQPQMRSKRLRKRLPGHLAHAERGGDRLGNEVGIGDGGQWHPPDAIGKRLQGFRSGLHGKPGLADAARTGESDEPRTGSCQHLA